MSEDPTDGTRGGRLRPAVAASVGGAAVIAAGHALMLARNGTWNFWDGRIVDFAIARSEYDGLRLWFSSCNLPLEYAVIRATVALSGWLHVHYRFVEYAIVIATLLATVGAIVRLACLLFDSVAVARIAALWIAVAPVWTLAVSGTLTHYLLFLTLTLVGAAGVLTCRSWLALALSTIAVVAGFQLNSAATMAVGLALVTWKLLPSHRPRALALLAIGLAGCLAILVWQVAAPPSGDCAGYNVLVPAGSGRSAPVWLRLGRVVSPWVLAGASYAAGPVLMVIAFWWWRRRRTTTVRLLDDPPVLLIGAALVAALPYVAIGRLPHYLEIADVDLRNSLVLVPFVALAVGWASVSAGTAQARRIVLLLTFGPAVTLTGLRYAHWDQRRRQEAAMVEEMRRDDSARRPRVIPGLVTPNSYYFSQTDRSWMAFRAWGTTAFYPCINREYEACLDDVRRPEFSSTDRALRLMYLTPDY